MPETSRVLRTARLTLHPFEAADAEAVRASFFEENPASGRVMEKSGMHRIAYTEDITYRGAVHPCIYCEIRREDDESGCRA